MPGEALVTNPEAPFALPARVLYEDWLAGVPAPEPPRERPRPCRVLRVSRLVAIADAHLGRAHYQAVDSGGLNQREVDFRRLHRAVEPAPGSTRTRCWSSGTCSTPPAHLPGVPEGARLRTLAEAGVPTWPSPATTTPRGCASRSPYAVLADAFPSLRFVYRGGYEPVDLLAGLRVHAVPQCTDDLALKDQIAAAADARSGDHLNLLVTHAAVTVLARRYTYGDVNSSRSTCPPWTPASTASCSATSTTSPGSPPTPGTPARPTPSASRTCPPTSRRQGACSASTPAAGTVRHHPVPGGRPLRSYRLDAFDLSAPEVYEAAAGLATPSETEGAVVRLFVNRARPELRRLLDRRQLGRRRPPAPWS